MNREYEEIRRQTFSWIRAAGSLAMEMFGKVGVTPKADRSPVTDADLALQDLLQDSIAKHYPGDAVIAEETQSRPAAHPAVSDTHRCWLIDPIDGTRNYARSLPVFTVSVALLEAGDPIVGVVYDPFCGRMYSGSRGGGAWVNEERIVCPEPDPNATPLLSIPTGRHEELPAVVHHWIDRMTVRNLGSTALHLALLATGAIDGVYCRRSKLWDAAAGALIARETGADIRTHEGKPYFPFDVVSYQKESTPFIAARPALLQQLLDEYHEHRVDG